MAAMIRRISGVPAGTGAGPGAGSGRPLIDGPAAARALEAVSGVAEATIGNVSPEAVRGLIRISRLGDFLAAAEGADNSTPFINYQDSANPNSLTIHLDLPTANRILPLLWPEGASYLGALMAPAATGEVMTQGEYLGLVRAVYGSKLEQEIRGAQIRLSLSLPGRVLSAQGGSFFGSRVDFIIPMADLLVLEKPLTYEVQWPPASGF
jgi:hypothetical protein